MKRLLLMMVLLVAAWQSRSQVNNQPAVTTPEQQYEQLTWLAGTWTRIGMKPGRTAYEQWEKAAANTMKGRGVTHREKDSLVTETLQLTIKDSSIWYVADVPENKGLVWFRLTATDPNGFTAENPLHDFPTTIIYRREGDKLRVVVSNQERTLTFNFVRQIP